MDILDYIRKGGENAITREELCIITGLDDADMRKLIAKARREGTPIINAQDGRGYYIPTTSELDKAKRQYEQERKRAMKILIANKGLGKWLADVQAGRLCD